MIVGFKVNGAEGYTAEANTLSVGVVQDFDGVPVEGRRLGRRSRRRELGAHNNTKAALHRSTRPVLAIIG